MFGGLNRLLATAAVAVAVLAVPSTALASGCDGAPSAEQVYKECLQNGGGGTTSGAKGRTPTGGGQTGSTPAISPQMKKALKMAGKDGKSLQELLNAYGLRRHLTSTHATAATEPTAIGSAFDLGSGPTVLLIVLAGTAVLLLGATGFRFTRHRR